MPKRTNDFQHLISVIEMQLAPIGAKVTESKMMVDLLDESEREIDIAIEGEISGHSYVIGIECRDHSRRQNIEWIDAIVGKYNNLPVNKVVAVSSSGFTKNAKKKALKLGFETLSLREAISVNWQAKVNRIRQVELVTFLSPIPTKVGFVFACNPDLECLNGYTPSSVELFSPSNHKIGTVAEIVDALLSNRDVLQFAKEQTNGRTSATLDLQIELGRGHYILGKSGVKLSVKAVCVEAKCGTETSTVLLDHRSYNHAVIAYGKGNVFGTQFIVTLVEKEGENPRASISLKRK